MHMFICKLWGLSYVRERRLSCEDSWRGLDRLRGQGRNVFAPWGCLAGRVTNVPVYLGLLRGFLRKGTLSAKIRTVLGTPGWLATLQAGADGQARGHLSQG